MSGSWLEKEKAQPYGWAFYICRLLITSCQRGRQEQQREQQLQQAWRLRREQQQELQREQQQVRQVREQQRVRERGQVRELLLFCRKRKQPEQPEQQRGEIVSFDDSLYR